MKVLTTAGLTKLIQLIKSSFIKTTDTVTTNTVTLDNVALMLTGDQTSSGTKGFEQITIGDTSEYKVALYKTSGGDLGIAMYDQNNSAWMSSIVINNEGTIALQPSTYITAPTPATSDNSTKVATTAFVKNQEYITTTTKTVADSGCTFVLSNGIKIITAELSLTKEVDYSWSYGTTFTNTPKIFINRRTGASTTAGADSPWVRGTVGKSSCSIYATTSGNYMVTAIGN